MAHAACGENSSSRPLVGLQKEPVCLDPPQEPDANRETKGSLMSVKWQRGTDAISIARGIVRGWICRRPPLSIVAPGSLKREFSDLLRKSDMIRRT